MPPHLNRRGLAGVFALAASLSSCSTVETYLPSLPSFATSAPVVAGAPVATPQSEKIVVRPMGAEDIDCPTVEVLDDAADVRVGGQASASVRYQFEITQTARECAPLGDKFSVKVGVSGKLLIGPAGKGGAYSAQLRVVVRSDITQKTVFSKAYRVEANTGPAAQAPFQLVTEPIILPFTRKELAQDYTILAGFDNGAGGIRERRAGR